MKIWEQVNKFVVVAGAVVFIITTSFGVNAYFAKDSELQELKAKTSQDIAFLGNSFKVEQIQRRVESYQERIWKLEDRLKNRNISPAEKLILEDQKRKTEQEMKMLEHDKMDIEKVLDNQIRG